MTTVKPTILLVENSVSFTGAFKCGLQQAVLLRHKYRFVFVLSTLSNLMPYIEKEGFTAYQLPLLEIRKDFSVIAQYLPRLIRNNEKLKKIIRKEDVSLIIINDFYNLLGISSKVGKKKVGLITYVRFLPTAISEPFRKVWTYLGQKMSDKFIAVSDAVLKQLPTNINTIRIYDAIQLNESQASKVYQTSPLTTFLYLSNYIQGKGQDHALRAFFKVHESNPNTRLIYAGGDMGLEKNKQFKKQLQADAVKYGLQDVVQFLSFISDVEQLLKSADIVLNFSEAESFSMTVAEASYYGVAVIASRCGGPEEIILHDETGLLVENKNVEQMAAAMIQLSLSKGLQSSFGKKGREYVQRKFGVENYISSCTQVYDEVLENVTKRYDN